MGLASSLNQQEEPKAQNYLEQLLLGYYIMSPVYALEILRDRQLLHLGDFNRGYYPILEGPPKAKKLRWFKPAMGRSWGLWTLPAQFGAAATSDVGKGAAVWAGIESTQSKIMVDS